MNNNGARHILFGKYEMGRLLGQGTFAKVYKGRNLATQENVAIKVVNKDQVKKQGLMEQLKREISVMHNLVKHPNIVELKEVLATKLKVFFIMEYVKGGELFAKVKKGKLKEDIARKYFQQLISAVDYCHSRGVSHRDLKPENLLLDENGDLKVSDFGLSALPEQNLNDGLLHTQCGTPAYVAPEILRKKGYDGAKADIWSCGVVLFVLLAGYLPFQNENLMKMYLKIFKADYEIPPWISKDSRILISKLLVVDPEKRISIPNIMENRWFRKGRQENSITEERKLVSETKNNNQNSPPFYNAFEFISGMSSGFDLSSLFETKKRSSSMFTSKSPAPEILTKLESAANELNLIRVASDSEFKVKLQRKVQGRKGKLAVMAEVYEVAPQVAVVQFSKSAGDSLEYSKFCEEGFKPALKDIVWSWQGETNTFNN
ncbi:CBL-interacting serine/threonine-protein kinase 25-like [Mercurialis annua]|uniref:CBL-interacting serine/threonine-protein kinase 25-like n=1 Tax=Mercurialis annua TaxID=3986 RepID=UPI00215DF901|nr:CBL-interacting serine/threonine-protein kinase 25-like [Mercurialis annua]